MRRTHTHTRKRPNDEEEGTIYHYVPRAPKRTGLIQTAVLTAALKKKKEKKMAA